jgi:hypothetical protein
MAQTGGTSIDTVDTIVGHVEVPAGESTANATVVAFPFGGGAGSARVIAKLDSAGNFRISGLQPGLYSVNASVPGLIPSPNPIAEARRFYRPGDTVNLPFTRGGVITGKVINAANAPMVATPVRFLRVADAEGKKLPMPFLLGETLTDDRGIYRRFGLPEGTYLVSTGGRSSIGPYVSLPYASDIPTYAPSSTRDTAAEFVVRSGEEVTVDIQYRREAGHTISGAVAGLTESQTALVATAFISLVDVKNRTSIVNTGASTYTNLGYEISGLPDGEYELTATQGDQMSDPVRVTVSGEDVAGVNLSLHSLATISGHVVFETDPKLDCAKRRATARQEMMITARRLSAPETADRNKRETAAGVPVLYQNVSRDAGLDEKSDFIIKSLPKGGYWIIPQPPDPGWFVRSIEVARTAAARSNVARDGVAVGAGERFSTVTVTITDGAAGLKGRVTLQKGEQLPPRLRFYLVPAEKESSEDILRYFETGVQRDGSFTLANIAPGQYLAVTRPAEDGDTGSVKSIKRDAALRAAIFKAATALKHQVAFKPCEQNSDFQLSLTSSTSPQ